MNRFARYIFIFAMLAFVSVSMSSCSTLKKLSQPPTHSQGPGINNSVEQLNLKVATQPPLEFFQIGPGKQTPHYQLPIGFETLHTWYYQGGRVFSSYKLSPDGETRDQEDLFGTPCGFIAYARGSGASARSAKPSADLMRAFGRDYPLTSEEAKRDSFYLE